jgi:hypothetical protein
MVAVEDPNELLDMSYWTVLQSTEPSMKSLSLRSRNNTEATIDKAHIPRELIGNWATSEYDPFPDLNTLTEYAKSNEVIWKALNEKIKPREISRVISTGYWPLTSETILEVNLKTVFDIVNLVLEKSVVDGRRILIQGGKGATAEEANNGIVSLPDRASHYLAQKPTSEFALTSAGLDAENHFLYCVEEYNASAGSKAFQNIIPGEIKLSFKFRAEFLDANVVEMDSEGNERITDKPDNFKRGEAEKVFTQIYQYLNERNRAVGYLINDQEVICVRRIPEERRGLFYGVMDISPAFPLENESGRINAKAALWYLHYKYGIREPHLGVMESTKKPRLWKSIVDNIKVERRKISGEVKASRKVQSAAAGLRKRAAKDSAESLSEEAPKKRKSKKSSAT